VIGAFPSREVDAFGSVGFRHSRLARGEVQVSLAGVEPGGRIGGHDAVARQLFVVLEGSGWVRTDRERAELGPGQAALWEAGEWHESGTEDGMRVLIVEGSELESLE
jgi:quercetin dioxygenase-like cupin family protein